MLRRCCRTPFSGCLAMVQGLVTDESTSFFLGSSRPGSFSALFGGKSKKCPRRSSSVRRQSESWGCGDASCVQTTIAPLPPRWRRKRDNFADTELRRNARRWRADLKSCPLANKHTVLAVCHEVPLAGRRPDEAAASY